MITWLLGDIFSLVGGIMAGLIPTAIILALYVSAFMPNHNDATF